MRVAAALRTALSASLLFKRQDEAGSPGAWHLRGSCLWHYHGSWDPCGKEPRKPGSLGQGRRLQLAVSGLVSLQGRKRTVHQVPVCPLLDCVLQSPLPALAAVFLSC